MEQLLVRELHYSHLYNFCVTRPTLHRHPPPLPRPRWDPRQKGQLFTTSVGVSLSQPFDAVVAAFIVVPPRLLINAVTQSKFHRRLPLRLRPSDRKA